MKTTYYSTYLLLIIGFHKQSFGKVYEQRSIIYYYKMLLLPVRLLLLSEFLEY